MSKTAVYDRPRWQVLQTAMVIAMLVALGKLIDFLFIQNDLRMRMWLRSNSM